MFAEMFIPRRNDEQMDWFAELQRRRTKPEIAARIMGLRAASTSSDRLAQVKTPTLVMHPRGDVIVPFEQGRVIAGGIPDAKFVELDTANHVLHRERAGLAEIPGSGRRISRLAARGAAAPRGRCPADSEDLAALTAREREILDLVAGGANNQDIADKLFISEKTVRNHLTGHLRQDRRELAFAGHRVCAR